MGTRGYVLKKVFQAFLTLLAVIIFNFFLFRILPADPVSLLTRSQGAQIDAAEQAELRAKLTAHLKKMAAELDRPH